MSNDKTSEHSVSRRVLLQLAAITGVGIGAVGEASAGNLNEEEEEEEEERLPWGSIGGRWFAPVRTEIYSIDRQLGPESSATILDEMGAGSVVAFGNQLFTPSGDPTAEATYFEISTDDQVRTKIGRSIVDLDGEAFHDIEHWTENPGTNFINDGPGWFRNVSNWENGGQYRSVLYLSPDNDFRFMGFDDSVTVDAVNPDPSNSVTAYMAVAIKKRASKAPSSTILDPVSTASTDFATVPADGSINGYIDQPNEGYLKAIGYQSQGATGIGSKDSHIRINYNESGHSFVLGGRDGLGWSPGKLFRGSSGTHIDFTGLGSYSSGLVRRWIHLDSYLPEGFSVDLVNADSEKKTNFLVSPMWYEVR